jgi:hypothetical protein
MGPPLPRAARFGGTSTARALTPGKRGTKKAAVRTGRARTAARGDGGDLRPPSANGDADRHEIKIKEVVKVLSGPRHAGDGGWSAPANGCRLAAPRPAGHDGCRDTSADGGSAVPDPLFACEARPGRPARRPRAAGYDAPPAQRRRRPRARPAGPHRGADSAQLRRRRLRLCLGPRRRRAVSVRVRGPGLPLHGPRCVACGGELAELTEEEGRVPPQRLAFHDRFWECIGCGKAFWHRTHWQ